MDLKGIGGFLLLAGAVAIGIILAPFIKDRINDAKKVVKV